MKFIMLVEEHHKPIPESIAYESYGEESVKDNATGITHHGLVCVISGAAADIVKWLETEPFVWISEAPSSGNWDPVTIKSGLKK